jgi:hypothetical protein
MMGNERFAELSPRDLAVVWGRAFGQVVQLWTVGFTSLLETGSGESTIVGSDSDQFVVAVLNGVAPRLIARNLVGETFGRLLSSDAVIFTEKGPAGPGRVGMECRVDEARAQPIVGDIYRGEVVDAQGRLVAKIALDAGS